MSPADPGPASVPGRCGCAHPDDRSVCDGPVGAVRVVDRTGANAVGCVHHGAVLLASLHGGRVYPGPDAGDGDQAAVDAYQRAAGLAPFCFLPGRGGEPL